MQRKKLLYQETRDINITNNESVLKQLKEFGLEPPKEQAEAIFYTIPVVAIAVAVAVAVVYAAAYDEVAVGAEYYGATKSTNIEILSEKNPVLNIWALKDKRNKSFFVMNTFVQEQINETINFIKEQDPSFFEKNSKEDFSAFLKMNLLK